MEGAGKQLRPLAASSIKTEEAQQQASASFSAGASLSPLQAHLTDSFLPALGWLARVAVTEGRQARLQSPSPAEAASVQEKEMENWS